MSTVEQPPEPYPTDSRFHAKVHQNKKFSGTGYAALSITSTVAAALSGVVYANEGRPVDIASCAVTALFIIPFIMCTYFLYTLQPDRVGLRKFIFATVAAVLFLICSLVFGIVVIKEMFFGSDDGSFSGMEAGTMIIHFINAVATFVFICVNRPLFKALRWSNRSAERNGAAIAYSNTSWQKKPGTQPATRGLISKQELKRMNRERVNESSAAPDREDLRNLAQGRGNYR